MSHVYSHTRRAIHRPCRVGLPSHPPACCRVGHALGPPDVCCRVGLSSHPPASGVSGLGARLLRQHIICLAWWRPLVRYMILIHEASKSCTTTRPCPPDRLCYTGPAGIRVRRGCCFSRVPCKIHVSGDCHPFMCIRGLGFRCHAISWIWPHHE